jgi:Tol biopolymer transport system component/DNA-binding winged helix-turn-helix (wHTH) protein
MADGPEDFRLGTVVVRPSFNELVLGTRVERVEPQVMTVLLELAKHEDRVVSRDALIAQCWKGLAVTDDALTRCISRLRGVFKGVDSIEIETIPKRGYCLRVQPGEAVEIPAPGSFAAIPARPKRLAMLAAVAAVLIAAAFVGLFDSDASQSAPLTLGDPVPLTADPGNEEFPGISPDAEYVAYSAREPGAAASDIFLRRVDGSGPATRLTFSPGADTAPTWSPSGSRLAYIERPANEPCRIMVLTVPGGDAREVGRCVGQERETLDWLSERELVVVRPIARDRATGLFALSLTDGRLRRLTADRKSEFFGDHAPRVSRDGRYVAFLRNAGWFNGHIALLDRRSGRLRLVITGFDRVTGFDWDASDRAFLLAANRGETRRLWKIGVDGTVDSLPLDAARVGRIASSHDGLVAFERRLDMLDLAEVMTGGAAPPRSIAVSTANETDADFSPDGSRVALVSERTGRPEIWLSEGGRLRQLTRARADDFFIADWHPGGASLLVAMRRGAGAGLHVLDAATGLMRPLLEDATASMSATWSADGKSIYFASLRDGSSRIWNMDLQTRKQRPVSPPGFMVVRPSPDGRWLYLGDGRTPRILRMPTAGGSATEVVAGPRIDPFAWGVTPDALFFIERGGEGPALLTRHDLGSGERSSRALPAGAEPFPVFALHPDGSRVIVSRRAVGDTDLLLVRREKAPARST